MSKTYDFSGWATKSNIPCSDGRTIMPDAFKHNHGVTVPLVWNHEHGDPDHVLGHAVLENRAEGVYAYCSFNDTESGQNAKKLVQHGDVRSLSIYANQLKQNGGNVTHGQIREVSLVLAGANPGARIVDVMSHSDDDDECAYITADEALELAHSDEEESIVEVTQVTEQVEETQELEHADEETIGDVFNSMSEKQKNVVYALVGQALADRDNEDNNKEDSDMKHNVFEADEQTQDNVLSHSEIAEVIADTKRRKGSLKDAFLAHTAGEDAQLPPYGIEHIDYLFPDAKNVTRTPSWIKRKTGWVDKLMGAVHHVPFSRIKSMHADITADEARAKGYVKGKRKLEEVFTLLKRSTEPQTVYKKQKMDRDDILDITDFDVTAWLKTEMRWMLDEEIARAVLVGDGRLSSSDDKIKEDRVRPVWKDDDLYTIKYAMDKQTDEAKAASEFIDACVLSQEDYDGSGSPTAWMAQRLVTRCLLLKDLNGHRLYKNVTELATAMSVSSIEVVPVMKGLKDADGNDLMALIFNPDDYYIGADKGGSVNMFEDFDIDFNQEKYLIETRISGALVKPYSAVAISMKAA